MKAFDVFGDPLNALESIAYKELVVYFVFQQ